MADIRCIQETPASMAASSSTSSGCGLSTHEVDVEEVVGSPTSRPQKLSSNDMMLLESLVSDPTLDPKIDGRVLQDMRSTVGASSSTSSSSGVSTHEVEVDILGAVEPSTGKRSQKIGQSATIPIEISEDGASDGVTIRPFLSAETADEEIKESIRLMEDPQNEDQNEDQSSAPWTEDELDALWSGRRKHGKGNWEAMLQDVKLHVLKSRTARELEERWKEEEAKLLQDNQADAGDANGGQVLLPLIGESEAGRSSHSHFMALPNSKSEPVEVNAGEGFIQLPPFREKKEDFLRVITEMDAVPLQLGPSKFEMPSTLSGLQLAEQLGELGRLDGSRQGLSLQNVLDMQFSPPMIPASFSGRSNFNSGAVPVTNGRSFGPLSESLGTVDSGKFRFGGTVLDRLGGEFGLGLSADRRNQEIREQSFWPLPQPYFLGADQSDFLARNNVFRSQEPQPNMSYLAPPSLRLDTAMGQALSNNVLVSLPHNGGPISIADNRRRPRVVPSTNASSAGNTQDSTPSKLPHWLREAVKGHSAPVQPPLSPAIAAVVQATNLLYKDSKRLLPPLVHPGYPLVPPRELPKKMAKREHPRNVSQFIPSSRTESLLTGLPLAATEYANSMTVENLTRPLLPIPPFDVGSSVISRSFPGREQVTLSLSNGLASSSGRGHRTPPEFDATWKKSEALESNLFNSGGPLLSWQQLSRNSKTNVFPDIIPDRRIGEGSLSDPERISQFPQGLFLGDSPAKFGNGMERLQPNVGAFPEDDGDDESTSSKTVSDPGVRSNLGKEDSNSDDASSEETISDDGTQ